MPNKLGVIFTLAVGALLLGCGQSSEAPSYRHGSATQGPIARTISATGTVQAAVTVDVGTQVSGLIAALEVDFNEPVVASQIIARIDPKPYEAQLSQADAELAVAKANVLIQLASMDELEAELTGARANLEEMRQELDRRESLLEQGAISATNLSTARINDHQANAGVQAGLARLARQKAQISLARARVLQAQAAVDQRRLELDYTNIRSPVDGVIVTRNVDVGQTVAASLQAPVLFQIAGDMRKMQVRVSVDEADIGQVREGQQVFFTVDAFLTKTFAGQVQQIRVAGRQASNVVTYTVIVNVDNAERELLPGMTANVAIVLEQRASALLLPTAAIRLRLPETDEPADGHDWVWGLNLDGSVVQLPVVVGISDGQYTEITEGDIAPGEQVVVATSSGR